MDEILKTHLECGTTYSGDECPFCESEAYWQTLYKINKGLSPEVEILTLIITGDDNN